MSSCDTVKLAGKLESVQVASPVSLVQALVTWLVRVPLTVIET